MREMDHTGRILCGIQGDIFAQSVEQEACGSNTFIRRYMNSSFVKKMDHVTYLKETTMIEDVFTDMNREYGESTYGKVKFSNDEMFWIGYLYRYFSYVYNADSKHIFRITKGEDLRKLYCAFSVLNPMNTADQIREEKDACFDRKAKELTKHGVVILQRLSEELNQAK